VSRLAVDVRAVSKSFRLYRDRNHSLKATALRRRRASYDDFWALHDVGFGVPAGSTFGIVGDNGSGKSTLLKCIAKILRPDRGEIRTDGTIAALLELGSGFHPDLTGRENVYLNGSILGLTRSRIDALFPEIVDFAQIGEFIDQPVKNYSSGMYMRLAFAVAINVDPDILLVDEILVVGDGNFQDRCMERFADFRRAGKTIVIVSHALATIRGLCDEAAWLSGGELRAHGAATNVIDDYVTDMYERRSKVIAAAGQVHPHSPIRITDVSVADALGSPAARVFSGDEVTFRLHYHCETPIDRPVFVFALDTASGVRAWAQHSRDAQGLLERVAGDGSVELRIDRLLLQGGTYTLHAVVFDEQMATALDSRLEGTRFDVVHGTLREYGGVVVLGGEWASAVSAHDGRFEVGNSHE
jgi:ABC-type polysaccharide/polyol phosphate transport system ATPase subunit